MDTTWERDGLLFGSLSEEDCAKGGKWTVGDLLPPEHPGYSEIVKYKSWVARRDKYGQGAYSFKDRTDSGLWEYVMNMKGILIAWEKGRGTDDSARLPLHHGHVVEFPPDTLRSWELPADREEARGSTVLWSGAGMRTGRNVGSMLHGFYFHAWKDAEVAELNATSPPRCFNVQYVEVFGGRLAVSSASTTQQLRPGSFVYVKMGTEVRFQADIFGTYGIVLFY